MSKYDPLKIHLIDSQEMVVTLSFAQIERILDTDLPSQLFDIMHGGQMRQREPIHTPIPGWMLDIELRM